MSIRTVIADDCPAVRTSIRELLQSDAIEIVAEASDGDEAVALCVQLHPDVVILDLSMPRLDGLGAARQLAVRIPATHRILMTGHVAPHTIVSAFAVGIRGFVAKGDATDDLVRAIETVCGGRTFLSASACRVILEGSLQHEAKPLNLVP